MKKVVFKFNIPAGRIRYVSEALIAAGGVARGYITHEVNIQVNNAGTLLTFTGDLDRFARSLTVAQVLIAADIWRRYPEHK